MKEALKDTSIGMAAGMLNNDMIIEQLVSKPTWYGDRKYSIFGSRCTINRGL